MRQTKRNSVNRKKVKEFQTKILNWYALYGRRFPWRKKNLTNYQLIIAEVLLQRTKAETVAGFYDSFVREFPNWLSLVQTRINKIEQSLKPLGLQKQRAKRLIALANEMNSRRGRLPRDRRELEQLPFIGQYIANAIDLLILQSRSPLIDINMARLLERNFGKRQMADIRHDPYLQTLSRIVVNHKNSRELNWAIIDYAALVCKARKPLCYDCTFSNNCIYFNNFNAL